MLTKVVVLVVLLLPSRIAAQSAAAPKFFRLDFVVKEVEGAKVINSRSYASEISTGPAPNASIRAGSKVPLVRGTQFTYLEVGVNIDCSMPKLDDQQLSLHVSADVSSVLLDSPNAANPISTEPTIRQNKWSSDVSVALKKPTVIFSSDDLTTKRQFQLELTATLLK